MVFDSARIFLVSALRVQFSRISTTSSMSLLVANLSLVSDTCNEVHELSFARYASVDALSVMSHVESRVSAKF